MKTISPSQLSSQLQWRYATKQFDSQRKISTEDWSALENALWLSPSSGGLQPWKFIIITNQVVMEKLPAVTYGQTQVKDASHLVVFAIKKNFGEADVDAHIKRTAEVRDVPVESLAPFRDMLIGGIVNALDQSGRQAWAARQAYLALGNLLTSAALLGIDACPMEGFVPAQYDAILGLEKEGFCAVALCALGYRATSDLYATTPKVRFPIAEIITHI